MKPKLRTKQGLDELQFFSIAASSWENNDPQLDGFMAKLRGGGIFTNRVKSKINQATSAACKLCGEPDSLHHRVHDCSALDQLHQELNWDVLQSVPKQALLGGLSSGLSWMLWIALLCPVYNQLSMETAYTCSLMAHAASQDKVICLSGRLLGVLRKQNQGAATTQSWLQGFSPGARSPLFELSYLLF